MKLQITKRDVERLGGQSLTLVLSKARYWIAKADLYVDPDQREQALLMAGFWLNVHSCVVQLNADAETQ